MCLWRDHQEGVGLQCPSDAKWRLSGRYGLLQIKTADGQQIVFSQLRRFVLKKKTKIVEQQLYHSKKLETNQACSLPAARLHRETGWPWLNGKLDTAASNRCLREHSKEIILVLWKRKQKWSALFHGHTSILYAAAHRNDAADGTSFSRNWKMKQTNSLVSDIVLKYMTCHKSLTHTRILWYSQMAE